MYLDSFFLACEVDKVLFKKLEHKLLNFQCKAIMMFKGEIVF